MQLQRLDDVHLLTMPTGEQVLNADTVSALTDVLDEIAGSTGPAALVITGEGKTFNQGLDLQWVLGLGEGMPDFLRTVHALFGRMLRLDMPTLSALNGHAVAAGVMLAQCTDVRIMRADRGWFRLPEVELGLPFTTVMDGLIAARIPQPAVHRLMVLGEQIGGEEAARVGAVDAAVPGEDGPRDAALARAAELARFRGPVIARIREHRYRDLLASIDADGDRTDLMAP